MSGFIYKGQSTDTVLASSRIILATFDGETEIIGHERENLSGDPSMTRPVPNEYGTLYSLPSYEYSLIKQNGQPFTEEEQITVERWLTSPKYSSDLDLIDCDGTVVNTYNGKFLRTEWVTTVGGYAAVNFTFQCNAPYPTKTYTETYEQIGRTKTINLECKSDELEEYIYPIIEIKGNTSQVLLKITNMTDYDNYMMLKAFNGIWVKIDCDKCILTDATSNNVVTYEDFGWTDVGNIYWLRLLAGNNTLSISSLGQSGTIDLKITYKGISKKVGGWL